MNPPSPSVHPLGKMVEGWFVYPVQVYPHHTDYGGGVWHGSYITWMESARVDCLGSLGLDYATCVAQGWELPVVELTIRYHRSIKMGETILVKTRLIQSQGVRLIWDYRIESVDHHRLFVTAQVVLVPVNMNQGRIVRKIPPFLQDIFSKLRALFSTIPVSEVREP